MGAEATAKELPRLGRADALKLTLLFAREAPLTGAAITASRPAPRPP